MNNIRRFRESKGMTQRELAECINVTQQTIYKYENGITTPGIEVLQALSECFRVSVDDIIGNYEIDFSSEGGNYTVALDREEYKLVIKYRSLTLNKRKTFSRILDSIYNSYNGIFD